MIASVLKEVEFWAESCPCHGDRAVFADLSRAARMTRFQNLVGVPGPCPMCSRRAPELASGGLLDLCLESLWEWSQSEVALISATLSPLDRATVHADFTAARKRLTFTLQLKLSFWQQLPHCLCTLGHFDTESARWCTPMFGSLRLCGRHSSASRFDTAGLGARFRWA